MSVSNCNGCKVCELIDLAYHKQLEYKQKQVKNMYPDNTVFPIIESDDYLGYRHKNQVPLIKDKGKVKYGVYQPKSHKLLHVPDCPIHHQKANEIFALISKLIIKHKIEIYNEDSKVGLIRYLFVRVGAKTQELLVALVVAKDFFPKKKDFIDDLLKEIPEITTIVLNINNRKDSMVLADKERILYGPGYIMDTLAGYKFKISSTSFFQINPKQAEKLFIKAIDLAELKGNEVVLDAYCGIATMSILLSKKVKKVIAVDNNKAAILDGKNNLIINSINNVKIYCSDALAFLKKNSEKFEVVFLDPTRNGCEKELLFQLIKMKVRKIVYIACDIKTQKRDVDFLKSKGYTITTIQPLDMFCSTKHIENIVVLKKNQ